MKFEELLLEVDGFGKYQMLVYLMLCLPRLVIPMHFLLHNFISASPPHHCMISNFTGISSLSQDEIFLISLPKEPDGTLSSCKMFSRPQYHLLVNSSHFMDNTSSIQSCQQGWIYDHSRYVSTTAIEVSIYITFLGVSFGLWSKRGIITNKCFVYLQETSGKYKGPLPSKILSWSSKCYSMAVN